MASHATYITPSSKHADMEGIPDVIVHACLVGSQIRRSEHTVGVPAETQ